MKIYFEPRGSSEDNIDFDIYIKPIKGCGHYYTSNGELTDFYWANPKRAKSFDTKELPKELLYSFRHGIWHCSIPKKKKNNWTFEDLTYDKITPKMTRAYNKLMRELNKVSTIEDYHKLYPLILKGNRINAKIIDTLFKIQKIPNILAINGEIGIAFYMKYKIWRAIIDKLGWDNENNI